MAESVTESQLESTPPTSTNRDQETTTEPVSSSDQSLESQDHNTQNESVPGVGETSAKRFLAILKQIRCNIRKALKRSASHDSGVSSVQQSIPF